MDMNLSKLLEIVKDMEAWHAAVHGVTKSQTWVSDNSNMYFTYDNVYVSMLFSIHPTLSSLYCIHKSILYIGISIAAMQLGS